MAHEVFISYASEDKVVADAVCAALEAGHIRCYIAPRDVLPGQGHVQALMEAIHAAKVFVLVFSAASNSSHQVEREVDRAVSCGLPILPLRVEDVMPSDWLEYYLAGQHWLDALTPPLEEHLARLCEAITVLLMAPAASEPSTASSPALGAPAPASASSLAVGAPAPASVSSPKPITTAKQPTSESGASLWRTFRKAAAKARGGKRAPHTREALKRIQEEQQPARKIAAGIVDCTVFAPPAATQGERILVQVFVHTPVQAKTAAELAREFDLDSQRRGFTSLEIDVPEGSRLSFTLGAPGLLVDERLQTLVWRGRPGYVQFAVAIPEEYQPGTVVCTVTASLDTVPLGHIKFKLAIEAAEKEPRPAEAEPAGDAHRYEKAFISYSHRDREEVLKRVQMLSLKTLTEVFFQDIQDLKPGDVYEPILFREIDECDLFLLFWSSAAKESDWVMREVHRALDRKGGDDQAPPEIVPVIIEGPPVPDPPKELMHLHFDDPLLCRMASP